MTTFDAYLEGYDAYLRRYYESNDWKHIVGEAGEPRSPYSEDVELHRAWLKGWKDAAGESYVPGETRGLANGAAFSATVMPLPVQLRPAGQR
jgi:hypothetical protein